MSDLLATPGQGTLDLRVDREIESNGIPMGVLSDGTAYLTGRGLAALIGVNHRAIQDISAEMTAGDNKPRVREIANLLRSEYEYSGPLYIPVEVDGVINHAYPATVASAFLEYYAFVANPRRDTALQNHRILSRSSLQAFIYLQVGYDPSNRIPEAWRSFHDRVSLAYNAVPDGFFSIFKEMSDLVVSMIQEGVPVGDKTIPDVSVGMNWSKHWNANELEGQFGERVAYEHNYPDYFPQAASNPQTPWAYPEAALPEFRRWMREFYIRQKYPAYLDSQTKKHRLPPSVRDLAIQAVSDPAPETAPAPAAPRIAPD